MEIEDYIEKTVIPQIEWYDKKSVKCQKRYKQFQISEIIIAAIIPVLTGYSVECEFISITVGICGALILIIESITKLYNYHENWIQYRTTCELLKNQKHLYETNSYPYNTEEETIDNVFIRNIENIVSSENNIWKSSNINKQDKIN